MRIESSPPEVLTVQRQRLAQEQQVQSVFAEVLEQAGRSGYESATELESNEPLSQQIQTSWDGWYQVERFGRYAGTELTADTATNFGELLNRAYDEGAYVAPQAFLGTLSKDELETVQIVQGLARSIDVNSLTEEGALNLLLPPATQVDLNGDGLTQSGKAYGIRFPDSRTPPAVVEAWNEVTVDMPMSEKMTYELQMKLPVLLANIDIDANGKFVRQRHPTDPDFQNPMDDPNYSYVGVTRSQLNYLDAFKAQIDPSRYDRDVAFWQDFQSALLAHEAK